jgi:hypothetical protein
LITEQPRQLPQKAQRGRAATKAQSSKAVLFNRKAGKVGKNSSSLPDLPALSVQLIGPTEISVAQKQFALVQYKRRRENPGSILCLWWLFRFHPCSSVIKIGWLNSTGWEPVLR